MKMRIVLLIYILSFVPSYAGADTGFDDVSLVQLISNPKDYDGKNIRVGGFIHLEFEGNAIYLHEDDYRHSITKNGLWINLNNDVLKKKDEFNNRYVFLEGIFDAKSKGHMRLWSGSILISEIQQLPKN